MIKYRVIVKMIDGTIHPVTIEATSYSDGQRQISDLVAKAYKIYGILVDQAYINHNYFNK